MTRIKKEKKGYRSSERPEDKEKKVKEKKKKKKRPSHLSAGKRARVYRKKKLL